MISRKKIISIRPAKRIIIFFFCLYASFFVTNILAQNDQAGSKTKAQDSSFFSRPKIKFDAQRLRDPFNDYIIPEVVNIGDEIRGIREEEEEIFNPPGLSIQGLIWGGIEPCAIINEEVKKEGEDIEGVKILKIKKEGLELLYEGKKYNLPSVLSTPQGQNKNLRRK
ncbi:MAG: hypothetical protein ABIH18_05155 [Candidatus Omnitrophota bacterium]